MAILMAALTGLLIGSVMGLTGAGGGILAVPALVYGQGLEHATGDAGGLAGGNSRCGGRCS
jgi:uncharacterized membrane protein YfcA